MFKTVLPIVVISLVFIAYHLTGNSPGSPKGEAKPKKPIVNYIKPNQDYLIFVKAMEVYPRDQDGNLWDELDGSAPELRCDIHWQGYKVYTSSVKSDTLIASWELAGANSKETLESFINGSGGNINLSNFIQAAEVRCRSKNDTITVVATDEDVLEHDRIGGWDFTMTGLKVGRNKFSLKKSNMNAIRSLSIFVIDKSMPIDQQVRSYLEL